MANLLDKTEEIFRDESAAWPAGALALINRLEADASPQRQRRRLV